MTVELWCSWQDCACYSDRSLEVSEVCSCSHFVHTQWSCM